MKKKPGSLFSKTICAECAVLFVLTCLLSGCDGDLYGAPPTSLTPTDPPYNNVPPTDKGSTVRNYTFTSCEEKNTNYDLSPYKVFDEDLENVSAADVDESDLKSFAHEKFDIIKKTDDKSAIGTFQGFDLEIIRINSFNEWQSLTGIDDTGNNPDKSLFLYYWTGIADGGSLKERVSLDLYKDPAGCFLIVTACRDHKVIYDFFTEGSPLRYGTVTELTDDHDRFCRDSFSGKICTEDQALEWSKKSNVVVIENKVCTSGEGFRGAFVKAVNEGTKVSALCAQYYTPDEEHAGMELYKPKLIFYYIEYRGDYWGDGCFKVKYRNSRGYYESVKEREYDCLLHFYGRNQEPAEYANYDVYVLANDKTLTWEEVKESLEGYPYPDKEEYCIIFCDMFGKPTAE